MSVNTDRVIDCLAVYRVVFLEFLKACGGIVVPTSFTVYLSLFGVSFDAVCFEILTSLDDSCVIKLAGCVTVDSQLVHPTSVICTFVNTIIMNFFFAMLAVIKLRIILLMIVV